MLAAPLQAVAALAEEEAARETLYRLGTLSHVTRSLAAANTARQREGGVASPTSSDEPMHARQVRPDGTRGGAANPDARVSMVRVVASFAADARRCCSVPRIATPSGATHFGVCDL